MPSNKTTVGVDDLQTLFPGIAAEADGWDPKNYKAGSNKKLSWICELGHKYETRVSQRTRAGREGKGCPYCAGQRVLPGFNDLGSGNPQLSKEANGWDPREYARNSNKKVSWKCKLGHTWDEKINNWQNGCNCPFCSGHKVWEGFNDLGTTHPHVARRASGWDTTKVSSGSRKKVDWLCDAGHFYKAVIRDTCKASENCPYCNNWELLTGFNDLKTKYPDIASEANGWDPSLIINGSESTKKWICKKGHKWRTSIKARTKLGSGCPSCAFYGFNPSKPSYFYLMKRPNEQQLE